MKLSVRDTAKMLNVTEEVVYRWIREGTIPVHRVNDNYRFHRTDVLEWATARGIRVSPAEFHKDDESRGVAMPRLSEALGAGGVHYGVPGTDRESVLRAVVERMPIDEADREMLFDFLIAREALGS